MKTISKRSIPVLIAVVALLIFGTVSGLAKFSDSDTALVRGDDSSQRSLLVKIDDSPSSSVGEDFHFGGTLEKVSPTAWTIGGKVFLVSPQTVLDSGLAVGVLVKVEYFVQADGSFAAVEIETADADDLLKIQGGDDYGSSGSGGVDDNYSNRGSKP